MARACAWLTLVLVLSCAATLSAVRARAWFCSLMLFSVGRGLRGMRALPCVVIGMKAPVVCV